MTPAVITYSEDDSQAASALLLSIERAPQGPEKALQARAARLWPDSPYTQKEWLRAVSVVRATSAGWLLERALERKQ